MQMLESQYHKNNNNNNKKKIKIKKPQQSKQEQRAVYKKELLHNTGNERNFLEPKKKVSEILTLLRYRNGNIINRLNLKSLNISKETATASIPRTQIHPKASTNPFLLIFHTLSP
jgi:hypothetical protein